MKLAIVLPSFAGGGAERAMLNLAAGLDRSLLQPAIFVLDGQGPLAAAAAKAAPVRDLGRARLRRGLAPLVRALRAESPDAVLSTFGHVNVALLACRRLLPRRCRVLVRDANLPSLSLPNAPFSRLLRLAYRRLYRRADAVLCTSERMAEELVRDFRVPRARARLLYNPVDEEALRTAAARPSREPGPGRRFVAAGRLTPQKGFDRLLDLCAGLPPDDRVAILGEGPAREALVARAARLGLHERVSFPGFDPAPWRRYAGADAFLLPSRWEGMPNAALEALACGTPVIATPESGGIAEVARAAPPGAVRVAAFGDEFRAAMSAVGAAGSARLRPSLMPAQFRAAAVCRRLEGILAELA